MENLITAFVGVSWIIFFVVIGRFRYRLELLEKKINRTPLIPPHVTNMHQASGARPVDGINGNQQNGIADAPLAPRSFNSMVDDEETSHRKSYKLNSKNIDRYEGFCNICNEQSENLSVKWINFSHKLVCVQCANPQIFKPQEKQK